MIYHFNGNKYKSLTDYVEALKESDNRYNSYEPWSKKEDDELLNLAKSMTIGELADHFKRRKGAIHSRLKKLNDFDLKDSRNSPYEPIYKENIFEQIVADLKYRFELKTETDLVAFLKNLKKLFPEFHERINQNVVDMEYSNQNIQIIYVLRYFHAYWYQLYQALNLIKDKLFSETFTSTSQKKILRVALFGAGPAPEIIGITRFLEANIDKFTSVHIDIYDEEDEWAFARQTFLFCNNKEISMKENLQIEIKHHSFRMNSMVDIKKFEAKSHYDVISFQNCLNEFWSSLTDNQKNTFFNILDSVKPAGFAIFTDRDISSTSRPFYDLKEMALKKKYKKIHDEDHEYDALKDSPLPSVLSNGNFYVKPFSQSGFSAMRVNSFKTLIFEKSVEKIQDKLKVKSILSDSKREDMIGEEIIHKDFGKGIIDDLDNHTAIVEFEEIGIVALTLPVTRIY
jgi:hypothetical protein